MDIRDADDLAITGRQAIRNDGRRPGPSDAFDTEMVESTLPIGPNASRHDRFDRDVPTGNGQ